MSSSNSTENDVARVKYGLSQLNYYKEPKNLGMSTIPDRQMFDSVKKYQKDKGLHVDGLLKPQGETIKSINNDLREVEHSLINKNNNYFKNVYNWNKVKNSLAKENISDENKHQYMSCLASRGGFYGTGLSAGIVKEGYDMAKKLTNSNLRKQYGGTIGVMKDSLKDMKNNLKGLYYGNHNKDDCYNLLEKKID